MDIQSPRELLAKSLGLPSTIFTDTMLEQIADDPEFLHHLDVCRGDPDLLAILVREASEGGGESAQPTASTVALVSKATAAIARWARAGFERVSSSEYERRLSTCASCPNLAVPPQSALYRLSGSAGAKTVCGLCGCDVRRKAWMVTERCPDVSISPDGRW